MTLLEVVVLIVMAAILGVISQKLLGYRLGGLIISIILGFIGAFAGREVGRHIPLGIQFNLQIGDVSFPVFWALAGALLATFVAGVFAKSAANSQKKKK